MAMSDKERKQRQRDRQRQLGVEEMRLELTTVERQLIRISAFAAGYDDQTEYLLDLVRKDRDTSQINKQPCPDCNDRGCFSCCDSEAEIRQKDKEAA